jgi:hypothetical protein
MKKQKNVHIAVLAGGVTSSYVAFQIVNKYGKENCRLFFIDTFSNSSDDPTIADNFRFVEDVAKFLGLPLVKIEGKKEEEYYDFCLNDESSSVIKYQLKVKLKQMLSYLESIRENENLEPVLYFGHVSREMYENKKICLESIEKDLGNASEISSFFEQVPDSPYEIRFPLSENPNNNLDIKNIIQNKWGIELPRSERKRVHIAMFSGGAGSAYVAYYMVQAYGKEN